MPRVHDPGDPVACGGGGPVLHIEMRGGEGRIHSLFAASFLEWVQDTASSRFAREVGDPDTISLDETGEGAGCRTLQVRLSWPRPLCGLQHPLPPLDWRDEIAHPATARAEPLSIFDYDSLEPVIPADSTARGITPLIASVFARSKHVSPRSPRSRNRPLWTAGVSAAARLMSAVRRQTLRSRAALVGAVDRLAVSQRKRMSPHPVFLVRLEKRLATAGARVGLPTALLVVGALVYAAWPATVTRVSVEKAPVVSRSAAVPAAPPAARSAFETTAAATDDRRERSVAVKVSQVVAAPPRVAGATTRVARRAAPREFFGSLVISSDPSGADVSIDGVPRGRTPLALGRVQAGTRVVRLELGGHQRWSWAIAVPANKRTPIAVRLRRAAVPAASPIPQ